MTWKKEVARDFLALGSIPFYAIVIVRMLIIPEYVPLVAQLGIALVTILTLSQFIKFNYHIAQGLVLVAFTSMGYKDIKFTIFAFLLFIGMLISANYLKIKKPQITKGTIAGIISSIIAYYLTNWLF